MNTINRVEFQNLVNNVLAAAGLQQIEILLLRNQDATKWYHCTYTTDCPEITENTKYGIRYKGDYTVSFDWKSGKIENLLKSFLTKYANKQRTFCYETGNWISLKNETLDTIIQKNKDRVFIGAFYTTLYGIGFWSIFSSKKDNETAKALHDFLKSNNISYKNEYSDAYWVYRFKIGSTIEVHNNLLESFKKAQL